MRKNVVRKGRRIIFRVELRLWLIFLKVLTSSFPTWKRPTSGVIASAAEPNQTEQRLVIKVGNE